MIPSGVESNDDNINAPENAFSPNHQRLSPAQRLENDNFSLSLGLQPWQPPPRFIYNPQEHELMNFQGRPEGFNARTTPTMAPQQHRSQNETQVEDAGSASETSNPGLAPDLGFIAETSSQLPRPQRGRGRRGGRGRGSRGGGAHDHRCTCMLTS